MRYKIYYIPDALVFASDFHPNDYPLSVPDRTYDIELAKKGNIGMHIIGIPELKKYEKDILISASDYWSRYKYSEDVNVYRNDLHIAPNTLKETFGNTGNLIVYREEYRNKAFVREVPIAKLIQTTASGLRAGSTNRIEYQLQYLNLDADNKARRDNLLKPDNVNSDSTIFKPIPVTIAAADTAYSEANPGLVNRSFVIGEGAPDRYVSIYDMFYSNKMEDIATNESLATDYYYRVKPEVEQPNLEEVSGYAPIYKTDVNIVNHAIYSKDEVDQDKLDQLHESNTVDINFTPNQGIPVTEYRIYSGNWTESDKNIDKDASTLVLDNDNYFLAEPITIEATVTPGRVHVPEAYTDYNNNTYGCYKQKAGDASISLSSNNLAESQVDIYWDYKVDENGNTVIDYDVVTKVYHVDLTSLTQLFLPDDESRYLLRIWRQVEGDEEMVLLNDIDHEFDPEAGDFSMNGVDLNTNYGLMDELVYGNSDPELPNTISDTFFHHQLAEGQKIHYYATLYVYDPETNKYYVKKVDIEVTAENMGIITGIDEAKLANKTIRGVDYYNVAGVKSEKPFDGVNIVVTRFNDGTTMTQKMIYPTK